MPTASEAGDEGEGTAQEDRHLEFGDDVEEQGSETRGEQGHADVQAGDDGNEHCRPEHHEGVLEAQHCVFHGQAFLHGTLLVSIALSARLYGRYFQTPGRRAPGDPPIK